MAKTESIEPTYSNSTHSVFETSTSDEFHSATIECETAYCSIICDDGYGCYGVDLFVNDAVLVDIQCTASYACRGMTAVVNRSSLVQIECGGNDQIDSCWDSQFTVIADEVLVVGDGKRNALFGAVIDGQLVDNRFVLTLRIYVHLFHRHMK